MGSKIFKRQINQRVKIQQRKRDAPARGLKVSLHKSTF